MGVASSDESTWITAKPQNITNRPANTLIECDGADSECIKNRLYDINNSIGASGTFSIDENGDSIRTFVLREVRNNSLD